MEADCKTTWRKKWQHTLVFLPEKSHGQRSLVGYSPWGHKTVRRDLTTKQQQQYFRTGTVLGPLLKI